MKRGALIVLFLSMTALGAAYAAALVTGETGAWTAWVVALATATSMVATTTLGASRAGGKLGRLKLPFAFVLVVLVGGFALALALPEAGEPLWLGLPRRAAIIIYGVAILPLFVLPIAYAWTFEEMTLSEEDMARIEELKQEREIEEATQQAQAGSGRSVESLTPEAGPEDRAG